MVQMKVIVAAPATSTALFTFISHMVQMKVACGQHRSICKVIFISHMVQMKGVSLTKEAAQRTLYIPHGSDESLIKDMYFSGVKGLYIPHGSDEREKTVGTGTSQAHFISHMVQMKDKLSRTIKLLRRLYIPHGSDESYKDKKKDAFQI